MEVLQLEVLHMVDVLQTGGLKRRGLGVACVHAMQGGETV